MTRQSLRTRGAGAPHGEFHSLWSAIDRGYAVIQGEPKCFDV